MLEAKLVRGFLKILEVTGDLDLDSGDWLINYIYREISPEDRAHLIIDLSKITQIDFHGVMTVKGIIDIFSLYDGSDIRLIIPDDFKDWDLCKELGIENWAVVYTTASRALEDLSS